jgi:bla regulator protein blaR1
MYPVIAGTSTDGKYFYFWKHPYSASTAADGVELAAFDMSTGKLLDYGSRAPFLLTYRDNISANPKDSDYIAIINGGGREMYRGKELVLFNIQTGAMEKLTPEGITSMTPDYSFDGKSVVYASSAEQKDINTSPGQWLSTADHQIYEINLATKQTKQITNAPASFDFGPKYAGNKTILFFRRDNSNNISLWKIEDGKEGKLADKLTFSEDENYPTDSYYGHFDYTKFTDIK